MCVSLPGTHLQVKLVSSCEQPQGSSLVRNNSRRVKNKSFAFKYFERIYDVSHVTIMSFQRHFIFALLPQHGVSSALELYTATYEIYLYHPITGIAVLDTHTQQIMSATQQILEPWQQR